MIIPLTPSELAEVFVRGLVFAEEICQTLVLGPLINKINPEPELHAALEIWNQEVRSKECLPRISRRMSPRSKRDELLHSPSTLQMSRLNASSPAKSWQDIVSVQLSTCDQVAKNILLPLRKDNFKLLETIFRSSTSLETLLVSKSRTLHNELEHFEMIYSRMGDAVHESHLSHVPITTEAGEAMAPAAAASEAQLAELELQLLRIADKLLAGLNTRVGRYYLDYLLYLRSRLQPQGDVMWCDYPLHPNETAPDCQVFGSVTNMHTPENPAAHNNNMSPYPPMTITKITLPNRP